MERLTVSDLNNVCYDPWELCGMDDSCTKGSNDEGGCYEGRNILKMYRKLAYYEDLEERLEKIYGDCPGLLEIVVDHLEAHEGVDLPEPIFKARLLTDGEVDKWEAYKQLGTVEELREAREKQRWIPCSERLPEEPEEIATEEEFIEEMILDGKFEEYIVMIYGGRTATTLYYIGNNEWHDGINSEVCYKVIAWQPLPEPYRQVEKASNDSESLF